MANLFKIFLINYVYVFNSIFYFGYIILLFRKILKFIQAFKIYYFKFSRIKYVLVLQVYLH